MCTTVSCSKVAVIRTPTEWSDPKVKPEVPSGVLIMEYHCKESFSFTILLQRSRSRLKSLIYLPKYNLLHKTNELLCETMFLLGRILIHSIYWHKNILDFTWGWGQSCSTPDTMIFILSVFYVKPAFPEVIHTFFFLNFFSDSLQLI